MRTRAASAEREMVDREGVEPPTPGFSVRAARLSGAALPHNAMHTGEAVTVRGLAGRGLGI